MSASGTFPERAGALLLALLTAAAPALATVCYLSWFHQASLLDHVPMMSDSMDYWHEIKSFIAVGFDSGYYGYEELHAPFGRFGAHGPWYSILVGLVGQAAGFPLAGIPIIHLALLSACLLAYMAMTRPTASRSIFLLAFTLTYPPFFFWGPFSMQESLHLGLAIGMAGLTDVLERQYRTGSLTPAVRALFLCGAILACLMRSTWVLLFIPLLLSTMRDTPKGWLMALARFTVIFALMQVFSVSLVQAPFPYFDSGIGKALHGNFGPLLERFRYNLNGLFLDLQKDPVSWMFVMRYQILAFMPLPVLAWLFAGGRERSGSLERRRVECILEIFPSILLAATISMVFVFYLTSDIFVLKVIVPVFVYGVFYGARHIPAKWLWVLVVVNVVALPSAIGYSVQSHSGSFDRVGTVRALVDGFARRAAPHMVHVPGAPPWCNTLVISGYPVEILGVPPGIGLNFVRDYQELKGPLRSRYLLAPAGADLSGLNGKADLEELAATTAGTLYRNRLADCAATAGRADPQ